MHTILITVLSGALLVGVAAAQDSPTPAAGSPASEPQTAAPAPQQAQEPASQPQDQTQSPESQLPATQSTPQPSTPESPQVQSPQTGASSAPAAAVRRIAPGSVILVLLTKTIDAKKAKTGDEVVAKVTQDLKTNSGEVIVAKDTKVLGHVTEAQAHSKEQKESQVGIAFDRAVEKNGNEMQLPMSIQAIIGPQNNTAGDSNEAAAATSSSPTATPSGGNTGRSAGMGGSARAPEPSPSAAGGNMPTEAQNNARGPITAQTQGVVGISNLKLEPAGQNTNQGSVVSSEKNNVKLESGTMLLLKVNQ
jgi:hypothetical protein